MNIIIQGKVIDCYKKPIYINNVLDHYGLVPKAKPAISVDIEPKQPAICVNERNKLKESSNA